MLERFWHSVTENLGTKIISIVLAVVLWVVVLGSRNVEATKEVPIEIISPPDVVVSNEVPEKIAFRLSGPKAFLRAILDRREDPIRVNLSGHKSGLVTYRFFSDNIRVPIGVKVLSIHPAAVLIKLEPQRQRDVPVKLELRGIPPEGYRIAHAEVKPPVVRIKGAETRVEGITEVTTTPIDVSNLKENLEREVPLELSRYNIQLDGALPRVFVQIEQLEANYRVKDVDIRVLSSYKATIEPKAITVLVRATPEELKNVDRSQVFATVDLQGKPKGRYRVPVMVTLPKNIVFVRAVPEQVSVTLH